MIFISFYLQENEEQNISQHQELSESHGTGVNDTFNDSFSFSTFDGEVSTFSVSNAIVNLFSSSNVVLDGSVSVVGFVTMHDDVLVFLQNFNIIVLCLNESMFSLFDLLYIGVSQLKMGVT